MYKLKLAVNLVGWRLFIRRKSERAFQKVAKKVLIRDNYACQYCGFQAKIYQEVINLDGNYANNTLSNLATACCLCTQTLFLQAVGLDEMSGGQLIYLPELAQAALNSFCHIVFCAISNSTGYQDSAEGIYRSLKFRSQVVEDTFGIGTSQPAVMGQVIIEHASRSLSKHSMRALKDIRLLPTYSKFKVQLDAWAKAALQEMDEAR